MQVLKHGWVECPIDQLVFAEWNYKKDDEKLLEKLKANIRRNGLIENIIIRELHDDAGELTCYEVVNGNHRLRAVQELGTYTFLHVYNLGNISEIQAKRIAVETNETKFASDRNRLDELIYEVLASEESIDVRETLPYDTLTLDLIESAYRTEGLNDFNLEDYSQEESSSNYGGAARRDAATIDEQVPTLYSIRLEVRTNTDFYELQQLLLRQGCVQVSPGTLDASEFLQKHLGASLEP